MSVSKWDDSPYHVITTDNSVNSSYNYEKGSRV